MLQASLIENRPLTGFGEVTTANYKCAQGSKIYRCYGLNPETHVKFKEHQRQLNRVQAAKGRKSIGVDGLLGPNTLMVSQRQAREMGMDAALIPKDLDDLANAIMSRGFTIAIRSFADGLGKAESPVVRQQRLEQEVQKASTKTTTVSAAAVTPTGVSTVQTLSLPKDLLKKLDVGAGDSPAIQAAAEQTKRSDRTTKLMIAGVFGALVITTAVLWVRAR